MENRKINKNNFDNTLKYNKNERFINNNYKHTLIKSIYLTYIHNQHKSHQTCMLLCNKLISICNVSKNIEVKKIDRFVNKLNETNMNEKTIEFEHLITGTEIKVKKHLRIIEDIQSADILNWIKEFKEVVSCNIWDDETIVNILKNLLRKKAFEEIKNFKTSENIFKKLLRIKYPNEDAFYYHNLLLSTKQKDFHFIHEYIDHIKALVERYYICLGQTKIDTQIKIEEIFQNGLDEACRLKMLEENAYTIDEIKQKIEKIENFIRESSAQNTFLPIEPPSKEEKGGRQKYCTLHKSTTHDNSECYQQKKKTDKQDQRKAMIVKETVQNPRSIEFKANNLENNSEIIITVDSGASFSLITEELILNKSKIKPLKNIVKLKTANNDDMVCNSSYIFSFKPHDSQTTFTTEILIPKKLASDIILGNPFLFEHRCLIDYHNHCVRLRGIHVPFYDENLKYDSFSPDLEIMETSKLLGIKNKIFKKINKIKEENIDKKDFLPAIKNAEFQLKLTTETPIKSKFYEIPIKYEDKFKAELKRLEKMKIIKRSESNYSSPCFVSVKKNGDIRIINDYRKLNKITVDLNEHFPGINENLHKFKGTKIFSTLDMRSGYYQVQIRPEDTHKTAFATKFGKFEYLRVPFGLKNAPKYFHALIQKILFDIDEVTVFVDDIIVYTKDEEKHYLVLEKLFNIFKEHNITINIEKCVFMVNQVSYLGVIINEDGIKVDESRLKDFRMWKTPTTRKQLQKLLGIINWYRPFIARLSLKLSPLYEKLKNKNENFKFDDTDRKSVEGIYNEIKKQTTLHYPDPNKTFTMYTDASEIGMSCILTQENKIISILSKKLNTNQSKYSVMEKELLAILYGLKTLRKIVLGSKVFIYTDNKNILFDKENYSNKATKWCALLTEYDIELKHIAGKDNIAANNLSRNIITQIKDNNNDHEFLKKFHTLNGHPGITSSYLTLRRFIENKDLYKYLKTQILNCEDCQKCKKNNFGYGKIKGNLDTKEKLQHLCSDIVGPYEGTEYEHDLPKNSIYIITLIDRHSRYTKIKFTNKIDGYAIIELIKEWIKEFGNFQTLLSDQGKGYISKHLNKFHQQLNIKQIHTSTYNPTGNGISERLNKTINECMRMNKGKSLEYVKIIIENRLNNIVNTCLGYAPVEIIKNVNPFNIYNKKIEKIKVRKYRNKKHRRIDWNYEINTTVLLKNFNRNKIDDVWNGPYKIIEVSDDKQRVKIDMYGELIWHNIKNIKPFNTGRMS